MSSITEEQYRKLQGEVNAAKAEADRAQGAMDQLTARLRDEFECKNLGEAKALLADLESQVAKAEADFDKAMKAYRAKWKEEGRESTD